MSLRTMPWITMTILLSLTIAGPVSAVYQIGDHVADFTLPNAYGQSVSLYDYRDRIVLLPFWFSS